jgi:hypothetical protein
MFCQLLILNFQIANIRIIMKYSAHFSLLDKIKFKSQTSNLQTSTPKNEQNKNSSRQISENFDYI